jgi:hypothetical protein
VAVAPVVPASGAGFTDGDGGVVATLAGEPDEEPEARPARNSENAATNTAPAPAATLVDQATFLMPSSRRFDLDGAIATSDRSHRHRSGEPKRYEGQVRRR